MQPIIEVKNLGKKYNIDHERGGYVALRDVLTNVLKRPFSFLKSKAKQAVGLEHKEEFWALRDVNFSINKGEVIGVIGRNGAGKSTLLKILSQITPPTEGEITLRGRVGSLLEVGTGFHPELTGRENIFLNGAILGMKRAEIAKKFDQIVEFAGVEKFLDTPVKRYSSGMYVRLAFSVAAHMEPDILIVDEVLAVGDAEFQKKCLGKMEEVTRTEGRTIIFVSHNMAAIERICDRVLVLKNGLTIFDGPVDEAINLYLNSGLILENERVWKDTGKAPGDDVARITRVFVHDKTGHIKNDFDITKEVGITIEFNVLKSGYSFTQGISVLNEQGVNIFDSHNVNGNDEVVYNEGKYASTVWINGNLMAEGIFSINAAIFSRKPFNIHAYSKDTVSFRVNDEIRGDSARGKYSGAFPGVVRPFLKWTVTEIS